MRTVPVLGTILTKVLRAQVLAVHPGSSDGSKTRHSLFFCDQRRLFWCHGKQISNLSKCGDLKFERRSSGATVHDNPRPIILINPALPEFSQYRDLSLNIEKYRTI